MAYNNKCIFLPHYILTVNSKTGTFPFPPIIITKTKSIYFFTPNRVAAETWKSLSANKVRAPCICVYRACCISRCTRCARAPIKLMAVSLCRVYLPFIAPLFISNKHLQKARERRIQGERGTAVLSGGKFSDFPMRKCQGYVTRKFNYFLLDKFWNVLYIKKKSCWKFSMWKWKNFFLKENVLNELKKIRFSFINYLIKVFLLIIAWNFWTLI